MNPTASSPVPQTPPKRTTSVLLFLGLFVVALLVGGLISRFMIPAKTNQDNQTPKVTVASDKIVLPTSAIQIQKCANNKGTLYVEPENIPVGPVYMINNGEVIGIEYMLSKDEFLAGKSYKFLKGLGLKVDHVNIGLLSKGHEGYSDAHYHVDIYTVPQEIEQKIMCPDTATSPTPVSKTSPSDMQGMPGMQATGSAQTTQPPASPSAY